ncbi:MAG: hypothetical protein RJA77_209, partial [Pseudomonadota bacterium]
MDLSRLIWLCPSVVLVIFPIWHRAPTVGFFSALLLSIWILFRCRRDPIHTRDWVLIAAFSAVPITTAIGLVIHDGSLSVLDRPLRLLLAVPIFIAFRTVGLNAQGLLAAAGWSAIAFGLTGIWDMTQGLERAVGEAGHPIVFGNTALLMGLICLWGLLSKASTGENSRRMALLGVGLAAGLLASLASGSRGGWIFALPMAVFMFIATRAQHVLSFRNMAIFGAGGALLLVMFGQMVFDRLTPVVEGVRFALQSDAPPPAELLSIVARVDMWREAIYAWSQASIFGVGPDRFLAALESRASLGYMEPGRAHAHSEVLT